MPVMGAGQAPARQRNAYSGPAVTVTPYYKFPTNGGQDVSKKWYPGKTNERGGGIVCTADFHIEIDGMRGPIIFNGAVIAHGKNGGFVVMGKNSWDKFADNGNGGLGANVSDYDFGPDLANIIRHTVNEGAEAITEDVLAQIYGLWEQWADEHDQDLLNYYYEVTGQVQAPPPPPPPPVRQAPRQAQQVRPTNNRPAPAPAPQPSRRPVPVPVATADTEDYGEQDDPFTTVE